MKLDTRFAFTLLTILYLVPGTLSFAQGDSALASQPARVSPAWLKTGVIYQVFPRSFSQQGTLNGVISRLDELHELGVNILWLMPIHPDGQLRKRARWEAHMLFGIIMRLIRHSVPKKTCTA